MNKKQQLGLGVVFTVFIESVLVRLKWLGVLSENGHQWITGTSVKFLQNWFYEGAFQLKFRLLENPATIEFGTGPLSFLRRELYFSYTPGFLLIPHFLSWVTQTEASPLFLMVFNLANQLLVALLLFDLVRMIIEPQDLVEWLLCALGAAAYILLPGPMYWHQSTFFSDQAEIVFFVGLIWWLTRTKTVPFKLVHHLVTFILAFFLSYTGWLGPVAMGAIFFAPLVFDRQSIRQLLARRWTLVPAGLLALVLYWGQIELAGGWGHLISKVKERTGMAAGDPITIPKLLARISSNVGRFETVLILVGLMMLLWPKKAREGSRFVRMLPREVVFLFFLPPLLVMLFLRNFTFIHSFSAIKAFPFLALSFFSLGLFRVIESCSVKARRGAVAGAGVLLLVMHTQFPFHFQDPLKRAGFYRALRERAHADEVYLSDRLEIPANPPQAIALSRRRIFRIAGTEDFTKLQAQVAESLPSVPVNYVIALDESSVCRTKLRGAGWVEESMPDHVYLYTTPEPLAAWPCL